MPLKEYQREVVEEFGRWYDLLKTEYGRVVEAEAAIKKMKQDGYDETVIEQVHRSSEVNLAGVWRDFHGTTSGVEWHNRKGPGGRPIPHVCIQVPTGGGKTRMAAAMLKKIGGARGLVLWVVPSKAIMRQTMGTLKDKADPIRQILDDVSGNRIEVVQKDARITKSMLHNNLCIMPLMQQAANRVKTDFLKMQKDSSLYTEFFPDTDEDDKNSKLIRGNPGLDMMDCTDLPRKNLVNTLRIIRPIIILDESHKASARNFGVWAEHINQLGPKLVIELSATPNPEESNILHRVSGLELQAESMIKKQIQVTTSNLNWQATLKQSVSKLQELETKAHKHGRYIRPIMVIRVERTGKDQRGGATVHAEDVKNYLIHTFGIPPEQVAIKTADTDDIQDKNLMEKDTAIRYIITKDALKEGWDCPFAYMLVILDNIKSLTSLTQLLGRILRQPYTEFTGNESLDSCYVTCMYDDIKKLVEWIQKQLDNEGLTEVPIRHINSGQEADRPINKRRSKFEKLEIRLPTVLHKDSKKWVDIDYDKHILHSIDWNDIAVQADTVGGNSKPISNTVKIGTVDGRWDYVHEDGDVSDRPNLAEWVSIVDDLVPNAWQAARIVQSFWDDTGMSEGEILSNEAELQNMLLESLKTQVIEKAEGVFKAKLNSKTIRFDIHAPMGVFEMRGEYKALRDDGRLLEKKRGEPVQRSLFEPIYEEDFGTNTERQFARYLDDAKAIEWWHRVAAKGRGEYYLRGWQEHRIYPDFIAVFSNKDERELRIYETKGRHLENPDTTYKEKVLGLLGKTLNAGNLKVVGGVLKGDFKIVFDDEIDKEHKTRLTDGSSASAIDMLPVK